jgi:hypothetical protein
LRERSLILREIEIPIEKRDPCLLIVLPAPTYLRT